MISKLYPFFITFDYLFELITKNWVLKSEIIQTAICIFIMILKTYTFKGMNDPQVCTIVTF